MEPPRSNLVYPNSSRRRTQRSPRDRAGSQTSQWLMRPPRHHRHHHGSTPRLQADTIRRLSTGIYTMLSLTRRKRIYTSSLHEGTRASCADWGLAPRLVGFEQLPGSWSVLMMGKVGVLNTSTVESFPELGNWKKEIQKLVEGSHREGSVHSELRLANFTFTKGSPCRMLSVDFDREWRATVV